VIIPLLPAVGMAYSLRLAIDVGSGKRRGVYGVEEEDDGYMMTNHNAGILAVAKRANQQIRSIFLPSL
jgi:hypothetical protein